MERRESGIPRGRGSHGRCPRQCLPACLLILAGLICDGGTPAAAQIPDARQHVSSPFYAEIAALLLALGSSSIRVDSGPTAGSPGRGAWEAGLTAVVRPTRFMRGEAARSPHLASRLSLELGYATALGENRLSGIFGYDAVTSDRWRLTLGAGPAEWQDHTGLLRSARLSYRVLPRTALSAEWASLGTGARPKPHRVALVASFDILSTEHG